MTPITRYSCLFSLFLWCFCGLPVLAQENSSSPNFHFEIFELPGGESSNHVQAITQDSFGFIWFGSEFGLHRWDGYQFKTYLKNHEDSTSIASNYIESIHVGKDGTLWLGHWGHGISRFDYETESFQRFNFNPGTAEGAGSNYIAAMTEDLDGHLWIGTHHGVFRLDIKTGTFKQFLHDPNDPNSLSYNKCRTLIVDSEGTVWLGTGFPWEASTEGGLNRYRPETEDFIRYLHDPDDSTSLSNSKVSEIFEDSKGNFWVGTSGDGLHLMDRKSGSFRRLQKNPMDQNQLSSPFLNIKFFSHIKFIFEDQDHKLWIGAWYGGIKYYDPETGYMQDYYYDENNPQSLPEIYPWMMFQSQDGTLWGCTTGSDGKVFQLKETGFNYYPSITKGEMIYSFGETKDKHILIGTETSSLLQFNKNTTAQTPFDLSSIGAAATNLENNSVQDLNYRSLNKNEIVKDIMCMVEDKEGQLWFAKYLPVGLIRINPITGELFLYQHDSTDENSIGRGRVTDLIKDENDRIWAVTAKGDLNLYDAADDRFIKYQFATIPKTDLGFEYYSRLAPSAGGKIWLAGTSSLAEQLPPILTQFDPATGTFDAVNADLFTDDLIINQESIQGLQEDTLGNVWVCTNTQFKRINPTSGESATFCALHFGSLFFRGMTIDDQQRLWLFGDKISLFDPQTGTKSRFIPKFKPQSNIKLNKGIFKDSEGLIYFGGKNGFQSVDPNKIGTLVSTHTPESIISDFQFLYRSDDTENKRNRPVNVLTNQDIRLSYDQNAFTFQFAVLDFQNPESNRLEFKLEGYDEQWRTAGLEPKATYVKVPPGDYTFRVRGATHNSEWGLEKTVSIFIASPWWATWWAYGVYAFVLLGVLYVFYSIQLNRKLDKAEAKRLQELDAVKTRLYTNITHEFRTPLTVISGMASQVEDNPKEWFREGMTMIKRNSNRLLDLVNQMLDLSKLESGRMALDLQQRDVVTYLKYIVESLHSFAESKNVQIHFYAEEEELLMDFDPEKMQQIITNLLSNAIKFTPEGGHVYLSIVGEKDGSATFKQLQVKVRDTGQGIAESELPHIFDRFYQVDDSTTRYGEGTGIGLALVKELVKLMEGEILVKSKPQKGTEFTVLLPVKNESAIVPSHPTVTDVNVTSAKVDAAVIMGTAKAEENVPASSNGSKPKVLLIEDNPDVVALVASNLQAEYQIHVGKDGQEGIDIALELIPDLIITDVMMPYKDGFEVCRTLKTDERTSHIPIIMLTARADMESKLEGIEGGADAYLAKPFHKAELLLRIKKLLELRAALQQYYCSIAGLSNSQAAVPKDGPDLKSIDNTFIGKAKGIVVAHLDDFNFSVEQFCREIGLSHSQFHRKLAALTGLSASKFIRHIRLQKAKELLRDPELSITAVAFDTGFNDPSYFGRVFRQEFGISPSEFQEQLEVR